MENLSKEKQIEEMAKALTKYEKGLCERLPKDQCLLTSAVHAQVSCDYCKIAEFLYNAGYRKQSEGKWTKHLDEWDCEYAKCSCCEAEFYDSNGEDTIDMFYKFCPECGAKMKGGE